MRRARRYLIFYLLGILSILAPQVIIARAIPPQTPLRDFVLSNPPVFKNNPKWSSEIVYTNDKLTEQLGIGYTYYSDFTSAHLNVRNGFRVTIGQPAEYTRTIWLVGSSTLLDIALYDADTIPSQLQAIMKESRIINVGMSAARIVNMRNRLYDLSIAPGDIVVFYDGVMDAQMFGSAEWEPDIVKAIQEAREYTIGQGARFIHILEPNSVFSASLYEASVIDRLDDFGAMQVAKFHHAYAALRRIDPSAIDLTTCLDEYRRAGNVAFIDYGHLGDPAAAGIAAGCIANVLGR